MKPEIPAAPLSPRMGVQTNEVKESDNGAHPVEKTDDEEVLMEKKHHGEDILVEKLGEEV